MFLPRGGLASADLAAGTQANNLPGLRAKAAAMNVYQQRPLDSDIQDDVNMISTKRQLTKPINIDSLESTSQCLLDNVENLVGELAEVLHSHPDDPGAVLRKCNEPNPSKQAGALRQHAAGPLLGYIKPSLSTISEDVPLETEWDMSKLNGCNGQAANPYVHGILLPDWHVWAEQVSQLLNHFATEISVLTSRVECIDQRLGVQNNDASANWSSEACKSSCVDISSDAAKLRKSDDFDVDLANSKVSMERKPSKPDASSTDTCLTPSIAQNFAVSIPTQTCVGLTEQELQWLMANDDVTTAATSMGSSRKTGAHFFSIDAGEHVDNGIVAAAIPSHGKTSYGSAGINSASERDGRPLVRVESNLGAQSAVDSEHDSRVGDADPEAIRTEAEIERDSRLREMQEWRLLHDRSGTKLQQLHPPPKLPASPQLNKKRSVRMPVQAADTLPSEGPHAYPTTQVFSDPRSPPTAYRAQVKLTEREAMAVEFSPALSSSAALRTANRPNEAATPTSGTRTSHREAIELSGSPWGSTMPLSHCKSWPSDHIDHRSSESCEAPPSARPIRELGSISLSGLSRCSTQIHANSWATTGNAHGAAAQKSPEMKFRPLPGSSTADPGSPQSRHSPWSPSSPNSPGRET